MQITILQKVIERAGSQRKLAQALGITDSAVSQWARVPTSRVLDIERLTGISRHDLRPDIYPRDQEAA